jgi:hypothetical protein
VADRTARASVEDTTVNGRGGRDRENVVMPTVNTATTPKKPPAPQKPTIDITWPDTTKIPGVDVGAIASTTATAGLQPVIDLLEKGTSGTGNVGNDVLNGMKGALVEATWPQIAQERDLPLFNAKLETLKTDLGSVNAQLGIKLSEQLLRGDDAAVQKDPDKKAQTAAMNADPKQVAWLETGGVTNLGAGLTTSIPVASTGGLVKVNLGFNASAALEYTQVSPFNLSPDGVVQGIANAAVTLPISADSARSMKRGSEMSFTGTGTASLSGGLTAGLSQSAGPVTGGVNASVNATGQVQGNFKVDIEKLDGDKVRVLLSTGVDRKAGVTAAADTSVTLDGNKLLDDTLGGSFPLDERKAAPVSLSNVTQPGAFADGIIGTLEKSGIAKLQDTVKSYTAFHASAGVTSEEKSTDTVAYVFDLSNPQAQKAYNDLLRLNETSAAATAKIAGAGVTRNEFVDDVKDNGTNASITLAGVKLLLATTLSEEENGTLTMNGQTKLLRSSMFSREFDGVATGTESIKWESVQVTPQGQPANTFFHLSFNQLNKMTSKDDFTRFLRFADAMGVPGALDEIKNAPNEDFFQRLFSDKDDTKFGTDVYFTDKGLANIAKSTGPNQDDTSQVRAAYAWACTQLDPSLAGIPINGATSDNFAQQYLVCERNLTTAQPDERSNIMSQMQQLRDAYAKNRFSLGRDLDKDAPVFAGATDLFDRVAQMGAAGNEQGWTDLLVELGKSKGFDYMPVVAALKKLAGDDQTLLHSLTLDGNDVKLAAKDEGTIKGPQQDIANATTGAGEARPEAAPQAKDDG